MAALLDRGFEQMDVPIMPRHPMMVASRITLVSSAHAETVRTAPARPHVANWSVVVGSFVTASAARAAAIAARHDADAGEARVAPVRLHRKTLWRAEVLGLTQGDAQDVCSGRRKAECVVIRPTQRQVASR
jgi:D-alanyl-D-alanine carboxypeptidase